MRSAFKHLSSVLSDLVDYVDFGLDFSFGNRIVVLGGWSKDYYTLINRGVGEFAYSWHSSLSQLEQSEEFEML